MSKKTKTEETEVETVTTLSPDELIVKYALEGLREPAVEALKALIQAGEGSYLKRLSNDDGNFGKAVYHQTCTAANRKAKSDFQPDHRTVASIVRRGFLIRETGDKGMTGKIHLNEGARANLTAVFAAAVA